MQEAFDAAAVERAALLLTAAKNVVVLSGAGISMLPIAMPDRPITIASGASLPIALARSLRDTPIRLRTSWPIAFMV